jgi:hypothetical protein
MKNARISSSNQSPNASGFWQRVRERWFGGLKLAGLQGESANAGEQDGYVKVWDARRGTYRHVDLSDRSDPLWSAASSLAMLQHESSHRRPAA